MPAHVSDWDPIDAKRVALALAVARDSLSDKAEGRDVVMEGVKAIANIDRRTEVRGFRPTPLRSRWVKHDHSDLTAKDHEEILAQRKREIAAGESADVVYGVRVGASVREQEVFDSVDRVFRTCLVGKNQIRDWKILFALAQGQSMRTVGRHYKVGKSRVDAVQKMQLDAIWTRVQRLMPAPRARAA